MSRLAVNYGNDRLFGGRLSREEQIPQKFLESILLELIHAGLVESRKGPLGGYRLTRTPAEITVGDVIRALDGPWMPMPCAAAGSNQLCEECTSHSKCGARLVIQQMRREVDSVVDGTSLADLARHVSVQFSTDREPGAPDTPTPE